MKTDNIQLLPEACNAENEYDEQDDIQFIPIYFMMEGQIHIPNFFNQQRQREAVLTPETKNGNDVTEHQDRIEYRQKYVENSTTPLTADTHTIGLSNACPDDDSF